MSVTKLLLEKEDLGAVILPVDSPVLREPPRPADKRQPGYDEAFDFHTLFYGCFLEQGNTAIRLVGPSLLNLRPYVANGHATVTDTVSGEAVDILSYQVEDLHKVSVLRLDLARPVMAACCRLSFGELGDYVVPVQPNYCQLFAGKRVAFTMFKFEPASWLRDWAEFNIRYHGANALLIHHNDSLLHTTEEVAEALEGLEGLETLVVGRWPFTFGPSAGDMGCGWDSDFLQIGLYERIRHQFLADAKAVLNTDIDELVITDGHVSIFELAEKSPTGLAQFSGVYISSDAPEPNMSDFMTRRHRYFNFAEQSARDECTTKWALVPKACGEENQWRIHGVAKLGCPVDVRRQATMCHFLDLNTRWKHATIDPLKTPAPRHDLVEAFEKVGWL